MPTFRFALAVVAASLSLAAPAALVVACSAASGNVIASNDAGGTDGGTSSSSGSDGGLLGLGNGQEAGLSDGSLFNDGAPLVDGSVCVSGDAGPPLYPQRCVTSTNNECNGATDTALTALGIAPALLNGTGGNGFDDDCDGLVDEGCACPGNGQTKPCYLVPPSQIDPATKAPVGWCTSNSRGSLDCAGNEFAAWSGVCRGAQPPYAHDVCAPGDFNCDGVPENNDITSCTCSTALVQCPTAPITEQPYPDPTKITLIDGSQWIVDPAQRANAKSWTWTVIGGDCDNVLPHPTFAVYNQTDSTTGTRQGTRTPVQYSATAVPPRYLATPGQPLVSIQAVNHGDGVAGAQIYPAFALSGDYVAQGEWDLDGTHYVCTEKIQVRAPGIRAELCWDTVGGQEAANPAGNDIDLHLARMQGAACGAYGWDTTCANGDCYYGNTAPGWGYAASANSACVGWASRNSTGGCPNPRLDQDNISCDKTVDDPTNPTFCASENVNMDNPNDGDSFVVGVNHYGNTAGTSDAHPHVDLYCNGERVLSVGYNPVTGQKSFPLLNTPGSDSTGDVWSVGTIKAHVSAGQVTACDVATVPSHHADQTRDGVTTPATNGNQLCVDSMGTGAPTPYSNHDFVEPTAVQTGATGSLPTSAPGFCKH
jgi:hypothetical protein